MSSNSAIIPVATASQSPANSYAVRCRPLHSLGELSSSTPDQTATHSHVVNVIPYAPVDMLSSEFSSVERAPTSSCDWRQVGGKPRADQFKVIPLTSVFRVLVNSFEVTSWLSGGSLIHLYQAAPIYAARQEPIRS
jgi:hypothetical protein